MRVSIKGQVTVPLEMRTRFGIEPGIEVEFVEREQWLQLKPRATVPNSTTTFDEWLSQAAGSASTNLTTDELMAETRGEDESDGAR